MLAHRIGPDELAAQARIMVDAGAQCVYVVDSAGALLLSGTQERIKALVKEIGGDAEVGFHGHQNLSLGVANSVLAFGSGARQIDGSLCALGAGAGNAPTEILATVFESMGIETGTDVDGVLAAAEEIVKPMIPRLPFPDRSSIIQGRAGVYSSFLLHAERASARYGVATHDILQRVGGRMPAYCTGVGKAILAFSDPQVVQAVINQGLRKRTEHTITDANHLLRELAEIRLRGVAFDREESGIGVMCAASPIKSRNLPATSAISVTGKRGMLDLEKVAPAVQTVARVLSRRLPIPLLSSFQRT